MTKRAAPLFFSALFFLISPWFSLATLQHPGCRNGSLLNNFSVLPVNAATTRLFGHDFDPDTNKLVILAHQDDSPDGLDAFHINEILNPFVRRGIPCWSPEELEAAWRDEIYREMLANNVERIMEIADSPFRDAWVMHVRLESSVSGSIGNYYAATATVAAKVVSGDSGRVLFAANSRIAGTPASPAWIAETPESARRSAVRSGLSDIMEEAGHPWIAPPDISSVTLNLGGEWKAAGMGRIAGLATIDNLVLSASDRGLHVLDPSSRAVNRLGEGAAAHVSAEHASGLIAVARENGRVELWRKKEEGFQLENHWDAGARPGRLDIGPGAFFIAGEIANRQVVLWNRQGKTVSRWTIAGPSLGMAVSESGAVHVVAGEEMLVLDGDSKSARSMAERPASRWTRQETTIGAVSGGGYFALLGLKRTHRNPMGATTAEHIINIADLRGNRRSEKLPDDPGRTRDPRAAFFYGGNPRFYALAVGYSANRLGYVSIRDMNTGQELASREMPRGRSPESIIISADGSWLAWAADGGEIVFAEIR